MPRKGENIYKRKDGRWEGRYIQSYDATGKAKYCYIYGKTYGEVKRKLFDKRSTPQKSNAVGQNTLTYDEVLDLWLHSSHMNGLSQLSTILVAFGPVVVMIIGLVFVLKSAKL